MQNRHTSQSPRRPSRTRRSATKHIQSKPPTAMWRTWPSHMPIDRYPAKGMVPMGKKMVVVLVNGLASLTAFLEMAWVVPNVHGALTTGRNMMKWHVHSQFTSIFCKPWLSTCSHVWTLLSLTVEQSTHVQKVYFTVLTQSTRTKPGMTTP